MSIDPIKIVPIIEPIKFPSTVLLKGKITIIQKDTFLYGYFPCEPIQCTQVTPNMAILQDFSIQITNLAGQFITSVQGDCTIIASTNNKTDNDGTKIVNICISSDYLGTASLVSTLGPLNNIQTLLNIPLCNNKLLPIVHNSNSNAIDNNDVNTIVGVVLSIFPQELVLCNI